MPGPLAYEKPRDDLPTIIRWARVLLTLGTIPIAIKAFNDPEAWIPLIGDINVAVHEFGHMLFMPFGIPVLGETMVILGGSLFQVAFPLVFAGYFAFSKKHRDLHAATLCLWWCSINLVGVAVYVADARARDLTLISGLTGKESDGHDWYNLLSQWGVLNRDLVYAGRMRVVAGLTCIGSIVYGLWIAWQSGRHPAAEPDAGDNQ